MFFNLKQNLLPILFQTTTTTTTTTNETAVADAVANAFADAEAEFDNYWQETSSNQGIDRNAALSDFRQVNQALSNTGTQISNEPAGTDNGAIQVSRQQPLSPAKIYRGFKLLRGYQALINHILQVGR
jgi:hypothetical protein